MAKTKISEFSTTAGNNTDINSINIAEGCAPSGINDAIRELMRQLKEFQTGGAGDSVNSGGDFSVATNKFTVASASGNTAVAGTLAVTGVATLTAQPILSSLTASKAVFTDASKGLVSNDITGTGNVVMSNSPTLVTPALGTPSSGVVTNLTGTASININGTVGATTPSTGAFTTLSSTGNTTLGDADTDTLTFNASFVTGTTLKSAKLDTNTLALAAYDVDGTAYTNLVTLTAGNSPTLALTSTGVGTINNMSIGATTASTGAFTTLSASGNVTLSGGTANGVLYLNGSKVATSGSALVFDGTNLGIGTSSPAVKLTVRSPHAVATATTYTGGFLIHDEPNGIAPHLGAGVAYNGGDQLSWIQSNSSSGVQTLALNPAGGQVRFGNSAMLLTSSGNLGLGVTPSAWQVGGNLDGSNQFTWSSYDASIGSNYYYNSGAKYKASGLAVSAYQPYGGAHKWFTAPSGTAGNAITFTQAMTLDASGNLVVADTTAAYSSSGRGNITIGGSSTSLLGFRVGSVNKGYLLHSGTNLEISNTAAGYLAFSTDASERARIDSSGNLIQSAPTTAPTLSTNGTMVFNLTSNTNLRVSVRGSDGVTRTANITLA